MRHSHVVKRKDHLNCFRLVVCYYHSYSSIFSLFFRLACRLNSLIHTLLTFHLQFYPAYSLFSPLNPISSVCFHIFTSLSLVGLISVTSTLEKKNGIATGWVSKWLVLSTRAKDHVSHTMAYPSGILFGRLELRKSKTTRRASFVRSTDLDLFAAFCDFLFLRISIIQLLTLILIRW